MAVSHGGRNWPPPLLALADEMIEQRRCLLQCVCRLLAQSGSSERCTNSVATRGEAGTCLYEPQFHPHTT